MRSVIGALGAAAAGYARMLDGRGMVAGAAIVAVGAVGAYAADFKNVPPYTVIVVGEGAALRCADLSNSYSVRMLKPGEVLRVDGERGGWLRVEYPAGARAWVHAKDAKFDAGAKTLTLTQASALMALNVSGVRPWWPLLEKDLPIGTAFADAQPIAAADGTVEGYSVPAPAGARGYVRVEQVKKGTEQADGPGAPGRISSPPLRLAEAPKPAPISLTALSKQPTGEPAKTTPATSAPSTTGTGAAATTTTLPPPLTQQPPAMAPEASVPATPQPITPEAGTPIEEPAPLTITPVPATQPAQNPEITKRIHDLQTLREMFDRVMKSGDESEIGTVESEFDRTMGSLGSEAEDQRLKTELEKRQRALRLKREVFETRRSSEAAASAIDQRTQSIRVAMREVERQAVYTIVGTMIPSTVYDGQRGLPLMWRIESPDITSTRTIGYVLPRQGLELISKTGRVVGIVGKSKLDPALGVNIVLPTRVDVLRFVDGKYQVESSQTVTPGVAAPQNPPSAADEPMPPPPEGDPEQVGAEPETDAE